MRRIAAGRRRAAGRSRGTRSARSPTRPASRTPIALRPSATRAVTSVVSWMVRYSYGVQPGFITWSSTSTPLIADLVHAHGRRVERGARHRDRSPSNSVRRYAGCAGLGRRGEPDRRGMPLAGAEEAGEDRGAARSTHPAHRLLRSRARAATPPRAGRAARTARRRCVDGAALDGAWLDGRRARLSSISARACTPVRGSRRLGDASRDRARPRRRRRCRSGASMTTRGTGLLMALLVWVGVWGGRWVSGLRVVTDAAIRRALRRSGSRPRAR